MSLEKCFSVTLIEHSVETTEEESNPLHAKITRTTANKIAKFYHHLRKEKFFVGALLLKSNCYVDPNCSQGLFLMVDIVDSDPSYSKQTQDDSEITLLVSAVFKNHYTLKENKELLFKPVFCLPLARVIFGVRSDSTYEWVNSNEWKKLLTNSASVDKSLCRTKDALLFKVSQKDTKRVFDFFTLDCSPINQGCISVDTEVIITKLNENDNRGLNTESCLKLIQYTSGILSPVGYYATTSLLTTIVKDIVTSSRAPSVVTIEFNVVVAKRAPQCSADMHGSVFTCEKILKSKKLRNGDWVKVCAMYEDTELSDLANQRYAQIFSLSSHPAIGEGSMMISPQLWFNVQSGISSLTETSIKLTLLDSKTASPHYAKEMHLALIQSPLYDTRIAVEELKEKYFSMPRLIKKGDIIALSSKENVSHHQQLDDTGDFYWPIIYLKVSLIHAQDGKTEDDCGYLVDNKNTKIYQAGTTKSYVPANMEPFLSFTNPHPFLSDPIAPGMKCHLEKLHKLVFPLLKYRSENVTSNCNILLMGPVGCGKTVLVRALCRCLNLHLFVVNCHDLFLDPTVDHIKNMLKQAQMYSPCVLLLKDPDRIGKEKELLEKDPKVVEAFCQTVKRLNLKATLPVIVIGTTSQANAINAEVNAVFLHHVQITGPNEKERIEILESLFSMATMSNDVSLAYVAQRTAGLVLSDLNMVASLVAKSAYLRMKKIMFSLTREEQEDICLAGIPLCQSDLVYALEEVNSAQAQAIGAPRIPNVKWEDIGGLLDIKEEIIDTIQLPLQHPELLLSGLRRSGVLLYGPPGTGKTMLAKAVATECSLNFISIKGPELLNMYVGQSEQNVREVFGRARSAAPCIVFFDEIDSLAPNRGRSGDSNGVMDRLVSQLLGELDGLNKSAEVFVIGATNRPDLLDPALLRPGRFDRLLYVGIAQDSVSRIKILSALTRKFQMESDVDLARIESECPPHLTGADFYALCSAAYMNAISRLIMQLKKGENVRKEARVNEDDFIAAIKTLTPSVSKEELVRFEAIRGCFSV